ncbi:MAG TPA: TrkA family potassium uptake protein [Actinomycetes bacterium]|nr:TrkA family potassium uptake protein [Actinomycetes bacterium]
MHVVIMGCGRVGSTLAHNLDDAGHSIAVIDQNKDAFRRLGPHFGGRRLVGIGFDRETLAEAGIESADAFAAVSSGDNSNILAARVARETFGVQNVVARIYDPGRAEVYQRLGIPTVATVRWTADQILRRLVPHGTEPVWRDPSGTIRLAESTYATSWVGERVSRLERETGARVAFLTRLGEGLLPDADTLVQDGDLMHLAIREDDVEQVERVLTRGPEESDH